MKPQLNTPADQMTQEQLDAITETYDGFKVIGSATHDGHTIKFLEDGSEVILDSDGNEQPEWPE